MERFKTFFLFTIITLLLVWIGGMVGGQSGMIIAFVVAFGMNFYSYFFSDKLVLKHYNATFVDETNAKGLYAIVEELCQQADIPTPKIYIIPDSVPNAFATGRNPKNAAVAVTEGLLDLLNENEIKGVIAHELSHVRNYDILIGTVVASVAGAIAIAANILQYGAVFSNSKNKQNPIVMLALAIILPIVASVIQMTISRSREYIADEGAARLTKHPEWLQSALMKLEGYNQKGLIKEASQESAHMFIINPFSGKDISFASLFRTHPTTQDRVERLEQIKQNIR